VIFASRPKTRWRYRPVRSGFPPSSPKLFVLIVRLVLDLTNEIKNSLLASSLDVFLQSRRYCFFFGLVASNSTGLFDQTVVNRKVGGQQGLLYTFKCVNKSVADWA
jgi:hypothetical protein